MSTHRTMGNTVSGTAIAIAAATLFVSQAVVPTTSAAAEAKVHCAGLNACKGKSECATEKSSCQGQNACKGQGWVSAESEKACTDKGGKPIKS